ncbi:hypothetical protein FZI27_20175 [Cronobacter sakazakii]|nr:hypothetical protein FZI27_20175 [Cronobacter sakazakii]
MSNIVSFPGSVEAKEMKSPSKKKKNLALKVLAFLAEAVIILLSPFTALVMYFFNKISTLMVASSLIMVITFYQTSGVTKYFFMSLAYMFVAVLIKMICNKKGR